MPVYINTVTGREYVANSLDHIPGNIVNRNLQHEFIELDYLTLEYYKQYINLRKYPFNSNAIKAINQIHTFIKDQHDQK